MNPGREGPARPAGERNGGGGGALSGAEFAGIGVQFALTILVFAFAGLWLDDHLHTSPWLLLVCVFTGAAGGFYSMYRRVMAAQRRDAQMRAERRQQAQGSGQTGKTGNGSRQPPRDRAE